MNGTTTITSKSKPLTHLMYFLNLLCYPNFVNSNQLNSSVKSWKDTTKPKVIKNLYDEDQLEDKNFRREPQYYLAQE